MENFSQALGSDTAMGTHHIVWDAQSGCTVNKDTVAVSWFARGHQGPFVFTSSLLWLPVCGHTTSRSSWTFGCKFAPVWCSWLLSFFLPCPALVPGLALMSSTASISKCCLWWPSRSPPSRKHSSRGYVRNLWMQKQAKKKISTWATLGKSLSLHTPSSFTSQGRPKQTSLRRGLNNVITMAYHISPLQSTSSGEFLTSP